MQPGIAARRPAATNKSPEGLNGEHLVALRRASILIRRHTEIGFIVK